MQRKHIISLCILLCALAVLVAFRPSADETMPLTGSASAGLILLDGPSGGYYVLAVIDQSRADRAGIEAGCRSELCMACFTGHYPTALYSAKEAANKDNK